MAIASVSDSNMGHGSGSAQKQNVKEVAVGGKKKKRSNSPRVKIVGNRIYDSEKGKTCHQCRQKTTKFAVPCKNLKKGGKPCTIQYCENCLLTRYGENAREVAQLSDWTCPKCMNLCNCSYCMKRRGQQPTGPLFHTAKASGFKSVLDLLKANSAAAKDLESNKANNAAVLPSKKATAEEEQKHVDNSRSDKILESGAVSPMKQIASEMELIVLLPGELGKENSSDGKSALKPDPVNTQKASSKASKKTKHAWLKEISNENDADSAGKKKSLKRPKICKEVTCEEAKGNANDDTKVCSEKVSTEDSNHDTACVPMDGPKAWAEKESTEDSNHDTACVPMDGPKAWAANDFFLDINNLFPNVGMKLEVGKMVNKIPLPPGTDLIEIVGIEFPAESVGSALQLLEFCRAFGKVLDLKKGEPEAILREIVRKQSVRRGQSTLAVQFQIRVLTLILTGSGNKCPSLTSNDGKNSWLKPLVVLINESNDILKDFPVNWLQEGIHGYHNLDLLEKLTLLNFLCDEALDTETLRNFIDDQNSRHGKEKKEAKSKVAAAKEKEKGLRQNLQNEMAKVVLSSEASLPIEEHDALLTKLKSEVAQAHAEVLKLKGTVPKGKHSDATRMEPELFDSNGQVFWKLKSYGDDAVLLQDIKIEDETAAAPDEKWFVYGVEKKDEVNKYISSRAKILKDQKISDRLSQ